MICFIRPAWGGGGYIPLDDTGYKVKGCAQSNRVKIKREAG